MFYVYRGKNYYVLPHCFLFESVRERKLFPLSPTSSVSYLLNLLILILQGQH